jgi:hypothetical protein
LAQNSTFATSSFSVSGQKASGNGSGLGKLSRERAE